MASRSVFPRLARATSAALALLLAACGGGLSDASQGDVTIALTDAASDELESFEVDVSDIKFVKMNGSRVSVLSRSSRVDFVQLQSVSELLVGATLEAGLYRGIEMTLDFSTANVRIIDKTGPATILDALGNPITGSVDVEVTFGLGSRPEVVFGRNRLFVLDFDLDSSIAVDAAGNAVTFAPVIRADVDPTNPKPVNVTGLLQAEGDDPELVQLEKFSASSQSLGVHDVLTSGTTIYQINGVVAQGSAGLAALRALSPGTRVWAQGTVSSTSRQIAAVAIEAGYGVPGNNQDFVYGHVIGRSGGVGVDPTLTVLGRSYRASSKSFAFNQTISVSLKRGISPVFQRASVVSLGTDAVNVGQRVRIFGSLDFAGTALDAQSPAGIVRLLPTSVFGIAAGSVAGNLLILDITRIGLRSIGRFDFDAGSGPEADEDALKVDVTGLDASAITAGAKIRAIGNLDAVGNAFGADFVADSFVNHTAEGRLLFAQWSPVSATGLSNIAANALTLDVSGAPIKHVGDGFSPVTLQATPAPTIEPATSFGFYLIVEGQSAELHLSFEEFAQSLGSRFGAANPVLRVTALGTFDETPQVFSALMINVVLQ